ncbi:hypothetical protein Y032_0011g1250 [Ancylostoma ceylanicum]|uniref:Uncharacterized protein n=1 Tax=Ancylostoma ceylanicum TaxID=53326 RepID=A0A016VES5_9BILA|nr:hypothetical protein Y032_0011g1250 [Ancylostoma ceylanicum]
MFITEDFEKKNKCFHSRCSSKRQWAYVVRSWVDYFNTPQTNNPGHYPMLTDNLASQTRGCIVYVDKKGRGSDELGKTLSCLRSAQVSGMSALQRGTPVGDRR